MGSEHVGRRGKPPSEYIVETRPSPSTLTVGRADDPAESRADHFADLVADVMRPRRPTDRTPSDTGRVRRKTASTRATHRDALGGTAVDGDTARRIRSVSGGVQLPDTVRRSAEEVSGRDLSGVRVHRSAMAADLSARLQATAFTTGRDIFLGTDAAAPGSAAGDHLLAHEVGHVVDGGGDGSPMGRVQRRSQLRPLDSAGAPTVRRLFGSSKKKKKQKKADAAQAAENAHVEQQAAKEAEQHPAYPALLSAVLTVEQRFKLLQQDRSQIAVDGPALIALASGVGKGLPGGERDPGFGPLKRRLRIVASETQLLLDELSVADTKAKAGEIYLAEGRRGNLKALTSPMKEQEFDDQALRTDEADAQRRAIAARRAAGEALGLTKAEQTAITVFTAQDYLYINPAAANSRSWMLSPVEEARARERELAKKGGRLPKGQNTRTVSQQDDAYVATRMEEGSLHTAMAMRGLAKLPAWKGPTYRGEAFTKADFVKRFKLGRNGAATPIDPTQTRSSIASCSTDPAKAPQFAVDGAGRLHRKVKKPYEDTHLLLWEIELTNGRDIAQLSFNKSELEVVTLPGATFRIVSITRDDSGAVRNYENVWKVVARQVK